MGGRVCVSGVCLCVGLCVCVLREKNGNCKRLLVLLHTLLRLKFNVGKFCHAGQPRKFPLSRNQSFIFNRTTTETTGIT